MNNIKGILVTAIVPMQNHIANGGEKLLGNASSIKRTPEGKVYISGQMQRHSLFSAISRLNETDANKGETYVSNGDGISNFVEKDLRADLGGFMHPSKGSYSGRRTSPLSVTPAIALEKSSVGRDLMVRLKINGESNKDQALATKEFSEYDEMLMNYFLDVSTLSTTRVFEYGKDDNAFHVQTKYIKHVKEEERKRRVRLLLEATVSLTDYANQARNAIASEPQKILIVFDTKLSRKACRYFEGNPQEQQNIISELEQRGAKYFLGDDTSAKSVLKAYDEALAELNQSTLFDPSGGDNNVKAFSETFAEK